MSPRRSRRRCRRAATAHRKGDPDRHPNGGYHSLYARGRTPHSPVMESDSSATESRQQACAGNIHRFNSQHRPPTVATQARDSAWGQCVTPTEAVPKPACGFSGGLTYVVGFSRGETSQGAPFPCHPRGPLTGFPPHPPSFQPSPGPPEGQGQDQDQERWSGQAARQPFRADQRSNRQHHACTASRDCEDRACGPSEDTRGTLPPRDSPPAPRNPPFLGRPSGFPF